NSFQVSAMFARYLSFASQASLNTSSTWLPMRLSARRPSLWPLKDETRLSSSSSYLKGPSVGSSCPASKTLSSSAMVHHLPLTVGTAKPLSGEAGNRIGAHARASEAKQ